MKASHYTTTAGIFRCPKQTVFPLGRIIAVKHSPLPNWKPRACRLSCIELLPEYTFYSTQTQHDRAI